MKKQMTGKSIALLAVLILMLLGVCYFKLVLSPINGEIASLQSSQSAEQTEIDNNMVLVADMNRMQAVIDEAKKSGIGKAIPPYDNGQRLMNELYPILARTKDYSVNFRDKEFEGYLVLFPVSLSYKTNSYQEARGIINQLCSTNSVMQIENVSVRLGNDTRDNQVSTELTITYFEVLS